MCERFLQANRKALEVRHNAAKTYDPVMEERAWKLFCLLPVWLLRRAPGDVRVSKEDLCRRFDLFAEGLLETLCDEAVAAITSIPQKQRHERTDEERAMAACRKVQLGEVSRARQCLTGAALAPGNLDTLTELQNKRPSRGVSTSLSTFVRLAFGIGREKFLKSLKTAPRGSSPGPGGCTYEHLKIMMDEEVLFEAVTSLAQAKIPSSIASALTSARLTALSKRDGGVRGIATGCSLRRLVARALPKFAFRGGMRTVLDTFSALPRMPVPQPLFQASTESDSITF